MASWATPNRGYYPGQPRRRCARGSDDEEDVRHRYQLRTALGHTQHCLPPSNLQRANRNTQQFTPRNVFVTLQSHAASMINAAQGGLKWASQSKVKGPQGLPPHPSHHPALLHEPSRTTWPLTNCFMILNVSASPDQQQRQRHPQQRIRTWPTKILEDAREDRPVSGGGLLEAESRQLRWRLRRSPRIMLRWRPPQHLDGGNCSEVP